MKKINVLTAILIVLCLKVFSQESKNGTIRVKKVRAAAERVDTVQAYSESMLFFTVVAPAIMTSNGVAYDVPPQYIGVTEYDRKDRDAQKKFVDKIRIFPDCYKCKGTTVFTELTMMVNKDGSLTGVKVKKGAKDCALCDEEAMRIVKMMPKWKPAQNNGADIDLPWETTITFTYGK